MQTVKNNKLNKLQQLQNGLKKYTEEIQKTLEEQELKLHLKMGDFFIFGF